MTVAETAKNIAIDHQIAANIQNPMSFSISNGLPGWLEILFSIAVLKDVKGNK